MSTSEQTVAEESTIAKENGCDDVESLTNGESGIETDIDYSCNNVNENPKIMRLNPEEDKTTTNCIEPTINAKENHVDSNMNTTSEESMEDANTNNNNRVSEETGSSQNSLHDNGINSDGVEPQTGNQTYSDVQQTPLTLSSTMPEGNHVTMSMTMQADGQMTFTSTGTPVGIIGPTIPHGTTTSMPMASMAGFVPAGPPVGPCHPNPPHQHPGAASPNHNSASPATPPQSGASTPSPNTGAMNNGNQGHQQHVVHVHINPGETFTVRVDDQLQHIQGPATVRMVSNNGPPLPMPMQVPPGHMVQQIVDENGILTHVILSPQPPGMMGSPMTGGPNNAPQYYPPYGGPYSSHPQYQSPHHHNHHSGPQAPGPRGAQPHMQHQHGTPPPQTCNNHGQVHPQGPSPPLNSMDERANRQRQRMRKKVRENEYNNYRGPPRIRKKQGTNDTESPPTNSINQSHSAENHSEIEEERRAIQLQLSKMPTPKVTDIESRSALIQLSAPEIDTKEYEIDVVEFNYELMLCEKGRDGKYKLVYSGDATEITLKDLKPATEYHLKVCTILDDLRGSPTEAISFKTSPCEPDQPQPPKLQQKSKTSLSLKWNSPNENGSKISAFVLESEVGDATGNYIEVYNGLQKQYRVSKLTAATKYTFRLAAINSTGKSEYSEPVCFCTSGSAPSQPDPPMLSECYVTELVISWIKRPNDDEFILQKDDQFSGHGFIPVYNGPLLSHKINNLRRNKEYKFRLAARNEEGSSKWSEVVAYKTQPARPEPPYKPQIKGKIHPYSFRVTWDPPKDDGGAEITKYIVELDDGKGYEMVFEGTEREHTCYELIPGHTYRVRVAACSVGGRSDVRISLFVFKEPAYLNVRRMNRSNILSFKTLGKIEY